MDIVWNEMDVKQLLNKLAICVWPVPASLRQSDPKNANARGHDSTNNPFSRFVNDTNVVTQLWAMRPYKMQAQSVSG